MKQTASVKVPFIDLSAQQKTVQTEVNAAIRRIFSSQKYILGHYGAELEEKIAAKIQCGHAIGVANGSDALYLALLALGVGPGDEVITTPFSFFATAGSISRTGAVPVFADIEADTFNLDASKIAARVTKKTKAVLPVHLFGLPCDMNKVLAAAKRHGLPVVEDAAQSFGATFHGKQTGSLGDIGCFSFYPTKNLGGAGDGGILTTSSPELADKLKVLRNHGSSQKYLHHVIGINSRLDEIQAAVILAKLKRIDGWNAARQKIAKRYAKGLAGLPLKLPAAPAGMEPIHHLYTVRTEKRDRLHEFLTQKDVGSGVYYPLPLHLQPCYRFLDYKPGDMPVSEAACKTALSLPMFAEMTLKQADHVIASVREFFGK